MHILQRCVCVCKWFLSDLEEIYNPQTKLRSNTRNTERTYCKKQLFRSTLERKNLKHFIFSFQYQRCALCNFGHLAQPSMEGESDLRYTTCLEGGFTCNEIPPSQKISVSKNECYFKCSLSKAIFERSWRAIDFSPFRVWLCTCRMGIEKNRLIIQRPLRKPLQSIDTLLANREYKIKEIITL